MSLNINRSKGGYIFLFSATTGFCLGYIRSKATCSLNFNLDRSILIRREEILSEEEFSRIPLEVLKEIENEKKLSDSNP